MPRLAAKAYNAVRPLMVPKACFQTVREVLEGLTQNQELISVLTGQWGDYGMVPRDASFMMHATVVKHYFDGGNYPVGGAWRIADSIIPVIRAAGGEVFTYAKVYPSIDHEGNVARFAQDLDAPFPMLYISFPSAKDPEWDAHYPDKSTVEVLTMGPWEPFAQWAGTTWQKRGAEYEALKQKLQARLLEALYEQLPQLRGALMYAELSTPLSTSWFQQALQGEIYGLDHDVERFRQDWLHPVTPVPGLYLTGQDVVSAGVGGALMGGFLTTSAMLGRDAMKLMRLLKE